MAELVTIPISFLQFTVDYQEAAIRLLGDRAGLVQGIFDALKPWKPNIDDIELRATGKSSEQGGNFTWPYCEADIVKRKPRAITLRNLDRLEKWCLCRTH